MAEKNDEKKEYLEREEVKTMEKDVSRLRETEAQKERDKISIMRAEEEKQRERERLEGARQEAEQRKISEEEAQRKTEEVKKLKEEREKSEESLEREAVEKKEEKEKLIREKIKETQSSEEAERRRFLERVAAKAEGLPTPPPAPPVQPSPPAPPKKSRLPKIPRLPIPKISGVFPEKPSIINKIWVRVLISLLIFAILAGVATFWYWYFAVREEEIPEPEETAPPVVEEARPPLPLISTEATRLFEYSNAEEIPGLIALSLEELEAEDRFSRILLKNTAENEFLGLRGFFQSFNITPPFNYDKLDDGFTLFVYSQEEGKRLGLVVQITEDGLSDIFSLWEETLTGDLAALFEVIDQEEPPLVSYFRDGTYEGVDFRFQTFSRQDLGIVYAIFNDHLIITTSWKSMEKTLDKLREGEPLSFFLIN